MIYGIGTDIINLERSWTSNFKKLCEKVLTENENKLLDDLPQKMQTSFFAKQWAMKESICKAFGTGFRDVVMPIWKFCVMKEAIAITWSQRQ